MNVLFVCKWNQGRSQIAEALFSKYTKKYTCVSCGTHADESSPITLATYAPQIVRVLKEVGIDVSDKTTTKMTKELFKNADLVVVLNDNDDLPDYARNSNKVVLWKIEDPDGRDYQYHVTMRDQIDTRVKDLLCSLEVANK